MNILSITGILPIPKITKSNDFLIPLYSTYKELYPRDNVSFLRLSKFSFFSSLPNTAIKPKTYELNGFNISLLKYISIWRHTNIHAIIASFTAYYLNKRKIAKIITENKIDILHAEYIVPDGYLAYLISKRFGIPYVITTHNESRYFDHAVSKRIALKVLKNASFITPLNYTSMELYKRFNVTNTIIVPHGIEERFLQTNPLYEDNNEIKILSIGALIALKNIDKVLRAISDLKNNYKIRYSIVGSGPEKENLVSLVNRLNLQEIVDFKDNIPYENIPHEISRHDIFILPSYVETFGRVLFEAMSVGLPIICAKNTGIHGYFKEGEEGLSVVHHNVEDIKAKLSILLESAEIRKTMGQKAKKLMRNYTWDKVAKTFHDLYVSSTNEKN